MRGNFKKAWSLVLVNTIGLLSLLGCTRLSVTDSSVTSVKNQIRIGVLLYNAEDPFIVNICDSITRCIEEEQKMSSVKIDLNVLNSENDQSLQNVQIEQMIKEKYDVIAVNIVDRAEAANIIDKAKEAKIPIVFFNREPVPQDMNKWNQVYYIGANAAESGEMQGQILLKAIKKNAKIDKNGDGVIQYVMLEGEPGHQDSILRSYHSIKVLEDAGIKTESLAIDTAMWQRVQARDKMLEWIEQFGKKIEVVVSNNDEMALGAIEALEESGYIDKEKNVLNVPVVGVDGLDQSLALIKNDKMLGTVLNNADEQGKAIFGKLYSLATGGQSLVVLDYVGDERYLWIPHQIITKESIK
jgi:methyl-galactoside transport system substrate-binding protein